LVITLAFIAFAIVGMLASVRWLLADRQRQQ
jgi:uncharacterized membrane protein YqjE